MKRILSFIEPLVLELGFSLIGVFSSPKRTSDYTGRSDSRKANNIKVQEIYFNYMEGTLFLDSPSNLFPYHIRFSSTCITITLFTVVRRVYEV
ncbi:MAG: hypothetical protein ACXACA_05850, partial [Candidatus Ranarchaeia archaeon]|jgi:hypothetical protein